MGTAEEQDQVVLADIDLVVQTNLSVVHWETYIA